MTVLGIITALAFVWALLIAVWWGYWLSSSGGTLHPASWSSILTMPIWSVQALWFHRRSRERALPFGFTVAAEIHTSRSEPDAKTLMELRGLIRGVRAALPLDREKRQQLAAQLEAYVMTAPPGMPSDLIADLTEIIRLLREQPRAGVWQRIFHRRER